MGHWRNLANLGAKLYHIKHMHTSRLWLYTLVLFSTVFLASCTKTYNYPELVSGDVVLAIGDQFTAGTGASERFSYPELLSKSTYARVMNLGKAGRGTADVMSVLKPALDAGHVKLVILTIGFNDLQQGGDIRFLSGYLNETATTLEKYKVPLMLVGIPALPYKGAGAPHPVYDQLASGYKMVYEQNAFINVLKNSANMETPSQFNADGYRVFAENIEERLRSEGFIR